MCGIVGVYNKNKKPVYRQTLKNMSDKLVHRGPDGEGLYLNAHLGLAHRRLAILDTSPKGNQPMSSKDGKWTIVFNGCIYNYLELKQELQSLGHEFVTGTDTEVIAEGLSAFGTKFFERFNGMVR